MCIIFKFRLHTWNDCSKALLYVVVEGQELGRHIFKNSISDATSIIIKPDDTEEVKKVKRIIAPMLALDSSTRLSIHDAVTRLSKLLTDLGVQVLLAVNTVWKPNVVYSKLIVFMYSEDSVLCIGLFKMFSRWILGFFQRPNTQ